MSTPSCQICGEETNYRCLSCTKPICNRSNSCSVAPPEETMGWKAGSFVSFCVYDPLPPAKIPYHVKQRMTLILAVRLRSQRQGNMVSLVPLLVPIYKSVNVLTFHRKLLFLSSRKNPQVLEAGRLLISLAQAKPRFKIYYKTKNRS